MQPFLLPQPWSLRRAFHSMVFTRMPCGTAPHAAHCVSSHGSRMPLSGFGVGVDLREPPCGVDNGEVALQSGGSGFSARDIDPGGPATPELEVLADR